jgi:chorismate mutase
MTEPIRKRLEEVRQTLLSLHKALVDSERITYEQTVGAIRSPNHFLQLLTTDPWFAWLQPLSQLIVSMDEALDAKETLTAAVVEAAVKEASRLLAPSETGEGFSRHYFDALQRDPDVVLAHREAKKLL